MRKSGIGSNDTFLANAVDGRYPILKVPLFEGEEGEKKQRLNLFFFAYSILNLFYSPVPLFD